MYGGIDQLVDTYKGNPRPLAANVQQAQKQQPPGEIPPDLEEAMALQKIAELRNAFAGQQAMQAGGAQPSIMQKLKQIVGGIQQQAQPPAMPSAMPARPVMAARGGSIDQLASNLGSHYAGGGIVAFDEGGKAEDKRSLLEKLLYSNTTPAEQQRMAALEAAANAKEETAPQATPSGNMGSLIERLLYSNTTPAEQQRMAALQAAAESRRTAPVEGAPQAEQAAPSGNMGSLIERLLYSNITPAEQRRREALQAAANERAGISPKPNVVASDRAMLNAADANLRSQPGASDRSLLNAADADLRSQPAVSSVAGTSASKPSGGIASAVGAGGAQKEAVDPNSLRAITEAYLRGELGVNPETEREKAVDWTKKTLGLDALLAEKQGRVDERAKAIADLQARRTPEWIKGLQGLSKGPIRGGAGMVLGQLGANTVAAREDYEAQDLKYRDELDRLRDVIADAKIKGNYELVKEGMAAYKEVDARRRAAAQSTTSLLNTDEQVRARLQAAKDAAAGRAQIAAAQLEDKKAKRLQDQKNFLAQEERKWQDTLNRNPDYKKLVDARALQERLLYMSTDPKTQEKAQEAVDMYNEKIAKMMPTSSAGTVNIPPPPKGAVTRVG